MDGLMCSVCDAPVLGTDNYCHYCGSSLPWGETPYGMYKAKVVSPTCHEVLTDTASADELALLDNSKHAECPGCHHRRKDCCCPEEDSNPWMCPTCHNPLTGCVCPDQVVNLLDPALLEAMNGT